MTHALRGLAVASVTSIACLAISLGGCGSTSSSPAPEADASAGGSNDDGGAVLDSGHGAVAEAGASTDDASGACNTLADDAAEVSLQVTADPAPTGSGGTVDDGTYALTGFVLYDAAAVGAGIHESVSIQLVISGSTWQLATQGASSVLGAAAQTATFTPSGTSFTLAPTCPTGEPSLTGVFTASDTTITLLGTTPATGNAETGMTYTKM